MNRQINDYHIYVYFLISIFSSPSPHISKFLFTLFHPPSTLNFSNFSIPRSQLVATVPALKPTGKFPSAPRVSHFSVVVNLQPRHRFATPLRCPSQGHARSERIRRGRGQTTLLGRRGARISHY